MTEREACIALNLISGIGYAKYSALKEHFSGAANCFGRNESDLLEVKGIGELLSQKILAFSEEDLQAELTLAERAGVRILSLADEEYPPSLRELYDPPLCLYIRGKINFDALHSVAIVGSRRMSQYGARMAANFAADAAQSRYTVISGLAYGVDAVAHQSCMDNGGITVAVLGGGLCRVHPQEHVGLARRIVETGGAVISEFPMEFPVNRTSFPRRNRIVSGLSRGVIVIEAGVNSGAMITANLALDQGREVFAVPGHADSLQSAGCHKLIRTGATLAENFQQVLETFDDGLFCRLSETEETDLPGGLEETAQNICRCLQENGTMTFDALALAFPDLETGRLLTELMALEMKLLVRKEPGQRFSFVSR